MYWLSKYSFVTEKKIYKEIKGEFSGKEYEEFLIDLSVAGELYNNLLIGQENEFVEHKKYNKIFQSILALRIMSVSQCFVFLLSILRNHKIINMDLSKLLEIIEHFTFCYSVVCKLPGNKVERLYSKYARLVEDTIQENRDSKNLKGKVQQQFSNLHNDLVEILPSKELFQEKFSEFSYKKSSNGIKIVTYFLSKINTHLSTTNEHKIDFSNVNVEHILPQKPHKDWNLSKEEIKPYVNLVGNLTIFDKRKNSGVQNFIIDKKITEFKESELAINKRLVNRLNEIELVWDKDEIQKRHSYLSDLAYDEIFSITKFRL